MPRAHREPEDAGRQDGFALLVTVLFLLTVTAVIAPFVLAARTNLDLASDTLRKDRLDLLADGLVTVLARDLAAPPEGRGRVSPSPRSLPALCRTERLAIEVRVQDQRGLVDLNAAEEELLAAALRSLGMDPAEAASHARAMVAYRQPLDESAETDPAEEALVLDGFKHAPFEAVEEAYDFAALEGLPLSVLTETFTVHSQLPGIAGERMPRGLAAVLPQRPTPAFPFVVAGAAAGATIYRADVHVRAEDATVGYSGAIVAAAGNDAGDFTMVERTVDPNVLPAAGAVLGTTTSCDALFGGQVAALLRDASG